MNRGLKRKRRTFAGPPFSVVSAAEKSILGGRGLGVSVDFLHRAAVLAFGGRVTLDQFDHRHVGGVTVADAGLQDAGITALPRLVALGERYEELADDDVVLQQRQRLAAGVQTAALAE